MPRLTGVYLGGDPAVGLYFGASSLWAPSTSPTITPPSIIASTSGNTTGASFTVAVPPREVGDCLILVVSSNQAPTYTFPSAVTSSSILSSAGNRLQAIRLTTEATSFTVSSSTNAVYTWWLASWRDVDTSAVVDQSSNSLGNNTTSSIESPPVGLSYVSTGNEVFVRAANVNSSAVWTTNANNVFATTGGNAALAVRSDLVTADSILVASTSAFDRGNDGTTRLESTIAFVLRPVETTVSTLLANGSFETAAGNGVATSWEIEGTAPRAATCSLSSTGAVDGVSAQRMQYTGQAGDSGNIAMYQAPIAVNPGDTIHASVYLSGTLTNAYAIFGIEGFVTGGGTYISEQDTSITTLTGTPTKYDVEYVCPGNCTAVAVYFQIPAVGATTVADVYLDKAMATKK